MLSFFNTDKRLFVVLFYITGPNLKTYTVAQLRFHVVMRQERSGSDNKQARKGRREIRNDPTLRARISSPFPYPFSNARRASNSI